MHRVAGEGNGVGDLVGRAVERDANAERIRQGEKALMERGDGHRLQRKGSHRAVADGADQGYDR